jgi:hypothetical protein
VTGGALCDASKADALDFEVTSDKSVQVITCCDYVPPKHAWMFVPDLQGAAKVIVDLQ